MNTVTWPPSYDPSTASYRIQSSPDATAWAVIATVIHAIPGANWDAVNSVFFYDDNAGVDSTWYRVAIVDTNAVVGPYSEPLQVPGTYIPPWDTVQQIITQTALEVGLGSAGADVVNSTDANVLQLVGLLNSCGRELVHIRSWNHLRGEHTFTTVAGQSVYPLPADYHNMIDQTWWNRTNRLPVGGPVSPQEWQYLKARMVGVVFNVLFRPMNRSISLYPTTNTPGGFTIAYEYMSSYWVSTTGIPDTATADHVHASTDLVWFDPLLVMRKVKLDFLKAKGFDTTAAQQDYNYALEYVKGNDAPSPVLSANRRWNPIVDPLIGGQSVPVTGFGSP
jgi:hypothetical protein